MFGWFRPTNSDIIKTLVVIDSRQQEMSLNLRLLRRSADKLLEDQAAMLWRLKSLWLRSYVPGVLSVTIQEDTKMGLIFSVSLPAVPAGADISAGELTVRVAGGEQQTISTAVNQAAVDGLHGDRNAEVQIGFVFVDSAGNRSAVSAMSAILLDTIPPSQPGALGIVVTGENDAPVAEEPVAEEPVAEEPVAEEPVAEEPVAEEPVAEEPAADNKWLKNQQ